MKTADDYLIQIAGDRGLGPRQTRARSATWNRDASPPGDSIPGLMNMLLRDGAIDESALTELRGEEFGLPCTKLEGVAIAPDVMNAVPRSFGQEHAVVLFARENGVLPLAVADPFALQIHDSPAHVTGMRVAIILVPLGEIKRTIQRCFGSGDSDLEHSLPVNMAAPDLSTEVEIGSIGRGDEESQASESDAPTNNLIHAIIAEAICRWASHIHLEPLEKIFRVRYRVDGVLLEASPPPKRLPAAIVSRLKIWQTAALRKNDYRRRQGFKSLQRVAPWICASPHC